MKRNESNLDRGIRAALALVLGGLGLLADGTLRWVLLAAAAVLGVTAATGFCLLYTLLGIDTCKAAKECE